MSKLFEPAHSGPADHTSDGQTDAMFRVRADKILLEDLKAKAPVLCALYDRIS